MTNEATTAATLPGIDGEALDALCTTEAVPFVSKALEARDTLTVLGVTCLRGTGANADDTTYRGRHDASGIAVHVCHYPAGNRYGYDSIEKWQVCLHLDMGGVSFFGATFAEAERAAIDALTSGAALADLHARQRSDAERLASIAEAVAPGMVGRTMALRDRAAARVAKAIECDACGESPCLCDAAEYAQTKPARDDADAAEQDRCCREVR